MFRTSHNYVGVSLLSGSLLAAIITIGCGGRGMQSSNTSSNTPSASTPSSSAPGSGSSGGTSSGGSGSSGSGSGGSGSGSGGSGSGGTSAYFFAVLLSTADSSNHGQITLNTTGGGTVQLQSAAASMSYSVEFCQFPNGMSNCFSVGSASTDSSGNTQSSFTFSRSGTWAGIFLLQPSGGGTAFDSNFPVPGSGTQYQNPLQQAATISGGTPSFWGPDGSDPLSSGFVTITGNIAHITLNGALANASYTVNFCGNGGGSSCFADLGKVSTDANGNGAADIDTMGRNIPGVFGLARSDGALQFITGVRVP